ncbi:MAG TPA: hypothetical protein VH257_22100, partial [Chloroflexota bacterium]|nr:hypothetical protein [Chloroflexota bacterium]
MVLLVGLIPAGARRTPGARREALRGDLADSSGLQLAQHLSRPQGEVEEEALLRLADIHAQELGDAVEAVEDGVAVGVQAVGGVQGA